MKLLLRNGGKSCAQLRTVNYELVRRSHAGADYITRFTGLLFFPSQQPTCDIIRVHFSRTLTVQAFRLQQSPGL